MAQGDAIDAALAYDVMLHTHRGSVSSSVNFNFASLEHQRRRKWNLSGWESAAEKGMVWAEREICNKWRLLPASIKSWPGNFLVGISTAR